MRPPKIFFLLFYNKEERHYDHITNCIIGNMQQNSELHFSRVLGEYKNLGHLRLVDGNYFY